MKWNQPIDLKSFRGTVAEDFSYSQSTSLFKPSWRRLPLIESYMAVTVFILSSALLSAALLLSNWQQALILGGLIFGSILGAGMRITHSLLRKKIPKPMMLTLCILHTFGGVVLGCGLAAVAIYWWQITELLLLWSVCIGGLTSWFTQIIIKRWEPWVKDQLIKQGHITLPRPPSKTVFLAPTERIFPTPKDK